MTNVIYGHFDSAGSLHKQIETFARDEKGFFDNDRLIRLYAGAVAECLLDYEDWKEGIDEYFSFSKSMEDAIDTTQWQKQDYYISSFILDKDTELGRSIVRSYLDETPETSFMMLRNIRASLLSLVPAEEEFWSHLYDMVMVTLVSEQIIHHLCDNIIDVCIGGEGWTLGDCIQAMATLSGQYHAKVIDIYDYGRSESAVIEHDFDHMVHTMVNEAMRLGMPDHAGLYTMLAANDTQPYIPFQRSDSIDTIAVPLFRIFKVFSPDLRSMMIAKATGRMMAVASAGDNPEMVFAHTQNGQVRFKTAVWSQDRGVDAAADPHIHLRHRHLLHVIECPWPFDFKLSKG